MQDDKILFTEKVPAGKRTYFMDVMENQKGHKYLKLTESRANDGEYIRSTVRVYQEDFDKLFTALNKMQSFIQANTPPSAQEEKGEDLSF